MNIYPGFNIPGRVIYLSRFFFCYHNENNLISNTEIFKINKHFTQDTFFIKKKKKKKKKKQTELYSRN